MIRPQKLLEKYNMKQIKLTLSAIDKLPYAVDANRPVVYWDTELKGFGLRVGRTTKAFFVQRDINTKTYTSKIGAYGHFTPEQARRLAQQKLYLLAQGIDPEEVKREEALKLMTLQEVLDDYLKTNKKIKEITRNAYRSYLKCHVPDWLDKPVTEITEKKILERYAKIGEKHQTVANCVKRTLGTILNHAIAAHKLFDNNPVLIIKSTKAAYKDKRRDGHLKPHQLKAWYEAVNLLPNRTYRDFLLLVIFTGMRRNEALSLSWKNVDFVDRSFKVLETKNGDPLTLPMSDFIYELLSERKALVGDSLYVFPSRSKKGFMTEPKKGVEAVVKMTGATFMVHDLRRTFATIAGQLKVPPYALKAMLNHRSNDITDSYVIRDIERLREPMQTVATYIQQQMGLTSSA